MHRLPLSITIRDCRVVAGETLPIARRLSPGSAADDVAKGLAELDQFDFVEDLCLEGGRLVGGSSLCCVVPSFVFNHSVFRQ